MDANIQFQIKNSRQTPILIIDDEETLRDIISEVCSQIGIPSLTAKNGQEALDIADQQEISVFIVDLLMPVMDGKTFIKEIKKRKTNAIIIVSTGISDSQDIIDVMKMQVFDYIMKPIDIQLIENSIYKAIELFHLRQNEVSQEKNIQFKLRSQLEWLTYKEKIQKSSKESQEKNIIYNIRASLAQGGGLGTMISLVDLMRSSAIDTGEHFQVDKTLLNLLSDNLEISKKLLDGMNLIERILTDEIELKITSSQELVYQIPKMLEQVEKEILERKFHITYPKIKHDVKLNLNLNLISLILEELIINAFKYGKQDSDINIFTLVSEGYFCISVRNVYDSTENDGIPREFEKLVIEPFFRLHRPIEGILSEKFVLGLGLTIVDYIIRKHDGIFLIHNSQDFTNPQVQDCVIAEIFIPIN